MRILHINKYNHERDGVGRYMHDVIRLAEDHGHVTAILAMHHPNNNPSAWEDFFVSNLDTQKPGRGISAMKQLLRALWSYEAYKKTRAIIRAFRPDVIHAHNLYTHLSPSVLSAARREKVPVVLTAHDYGYISANYGLFDGKNPLQGNASFFEVIKSRCIKKSLFATAAVESIVRIQKLFGLWTRGVVRILTASQAVRNALMLGGYAPSRIHVLPLPSGALYKEHELQKENVESRMLFASRFEEYKGVDVIIELARRMPHVQFVCIGEGSLAEVLRTEAARHTNLCAMPTRTPEKLWEYMRTSAGVLVPSRWPEPYGLIALEALSLGTPAVVSDQGGLPEIVEHEVSGFVASPDDIHAWEQAIEKLLPNKEGVFSREQKELRKWARIRAENIGDPTRHWQQLEGEYIEAIHQKD